MGRRARPVSLGWSGRLAPQAPKACRVRPDRRAIRDPQARPARMGRMGSPARMATAGRRRPTTSTRRCAGRMGRRIRGTGRATRHRRLLGSTRSAGFTPDSGRLHDLGPYGGRPLHVQAFQPVSPFISEAYAWVRPQRPDVLVHDGGRAHAARARGGGGPTPNSIEPSTGSLMAIPPESGQQYRGRTYILWRGST